MGIDQTTALGPSLPSATSPSLRQTLETVTLTWVFGAVWQTATTGAPLTRFASELHASPWQFGLLTAMPFVASLLSLPASMLVERSGARKLFFLSGCYAQRILWFAIALLPLWLLCHGGAGGSSSHAVLWFLLLTFLMHAGQAFGGPAWTSWMADLVPPRVRGKFFSRRRQWGILPSLPAAVFIGWMLDRPDAAGPMNTLRCCAIIFMCAAVFGIMDVHLFHYVRDVPKPARRGAGLLRAMARPLRDKRFIVFGSYTATMQFSLCFMTQFVSLYLIDRLGVRSGQVQLMLVAGPMLAQLLVLGAWGAAADRMGKRPVLLLAGIGLVPVGLGWMFVGPQHLWLGYVLLAAGAALWTGIEVANLNLVMDSAGAAATDTHEPGQVTGGGTAYVATNSVIINIAGCIGGLAAGLIAQGLKDWSWQPLAGLKTFTSYDVLFGTSALLRLAAVAIFLPYLSEPGARTVAETARFMLAIASRAAGDVAARVVQPLRGRTPESDSQTDPQPDPESNAAPATA